MNLVQIDKFRTERGPGVCLTMRFRCFARFHMKAAVLCRFAPCEVTNNFNQRRLILKIC
jgi:hypothetical protein